MQFGFQKKQKKSYGMKLIEIHYFYFLPELQAETGNKKIS